VGNVTDEEMLEDSLDERSTCFNLMQRFTVSLLCSELDAVGDCTAQPPDSKRQLGSHLHVNLSGQQTQVLTLAIELQ